MKKTGLKYLKLLSYSLVWFS